MFCNVGLHLGAFIISSRKCIEPKLGFVECRIPCLPINGIGHRGYYDNEGNIEVSVDSV